MKGRDGLGDLLVHRFCLGVVVVGLIDFVDAQPSRTLGVGLGFVLQCILHFVLHIGERDHTFQTQKVKKQNGVSHVVTVYMCSRKQCHKNLTSIQNQ